MRSRRSWINWSCARNVADIFAFSACKAAIIAFRKAVTIGRLRNSIHKYEDASLAIQPLAAGLREGTPLPSFVEPPAWQGGP